MRPVPTHISPSLSTCEGRADLSFGGLLRLYLDPGALFMDASRGSPLERQRARRYNEQHRWMLLCYARRWLAIALLFFAGVALAESLGTEHAGSIYVAAGLAVACCIAGTASFQIAVGYLLLRSESGQHTSR